MVSCTVFAEEKESVAVFKSCSNPYLPALPGGFSDLPIPAHTLKGR